jgi:hypothetical protein
MVVSAQGPFTDMATAFAAMAMCIEDIAGRIAVGN